MNHLLVHYVAMTDRFGYLSFRKFVDQWRQVEELTEAVLRAGLELNADLVLAPAVSRLIEPKPESGSSKRARLIRAALLAGPLLN